MGFGRIYHVMHILTTFKHEAKGLYCFIIYKFLHVCPFDYMAVAVSGKFERL